MKYLKFIVVFFLLPLMGYTQNSYLVKGEILTPEGYSPSGNVIALNQKDSSFIKGDFFLDGIFILEYLTEQKIIIKLTSLEFDDTFINVNSDDRSTIDLGIIQPSTSLVALDEVIIKSKRPTFTQQPDGTISVLVANTVLASSNDISEILSRSPDVQVSAEGAVSVFGKGNVIFYLNGKRITNNRLSMISPTNIHKIEVIRNPSAKYDAEGAAVINIVTNVKSQYGYQVNLKQNITDSEFAGTDTYTSIDINLNKGKFSSFANYSFLQGNDRHILNTTRNRDAEEVYVKTNVTTEWKNKYENFSNYGIGLQYDLTDNNYLSLEYSGLYEDLGGNTLSNNIIEERTGLNYYESDIARNELDKNNSLSLNYHQSIDTVGSSLFIGAQHSNFRSTTNNDITEERIELDVASDRKLKNISMLDLDINSVQIDFTKVLGQNSSFEFGAKYSHITNGSQFNFLSSQSDDDFAIEPSLSNNFNYKESVSAAYISLNGNLSQSMNYTLGLRSEHTDYDLNLSQISDQFITSKYLNFFPNISLNKKFSDSYNLNLSYTARISRVPYQRLNPVLIYQDPYTSIQGNPESIAEKKHNIDLVAKLNRTTLKLGYSLTFDPFGGGALRGEDGKSYVLKRFNFNKSHLYYSSVSRTFETNWFSSTNTASLRFTNIIDNEYNFHTVGTKPQVYLYSNNRIPVSNLFNVELLFYYLGKEYEGVYVRESSKSLNLTIDKKMLNDALTFRLTFNDLFHSVRAAGTYNIGETEIYFHRKWNTNNTRLSVIYNFGKLKNKKYNNKAVGESESNRGR